MTLRKINNEKTISSRVKNRLDHHFDTPINKHNGPVLMDAQWNRRVRWASPKNRLETEDVRCKGRILAYTFAVEFVYFHNNVSEKTSKCSWPHFNAKETENSVWVLWKHVRVSFAHVLRFLLHTKSPSPLSKSHFNSIKRDRKRQDTSTLQEKKGSKSSTCWCQFFLQHSRVPED